MTADRTPLLVVDGDDVRRHVVAVALREAGLDAAGCASAAEALSTATREAPALVLVDVADGTPGGLAELAVLRGASLLGDVPVFALVREDGDEALERAFAAGADDVLRRPLRTAELVARVRHGLGSRARVAAAERRAQSLQRYADFFESAADGIAVIDAQGTLLFSNARAREITGWDEASMRGAHVSAFLEDDDIERARTLRAGFQHGFYPRGVDLRARRKDGQQLLLNVSFNSVLREENAIVFTFREVTEERATAAELQHTKEFLERVIDSSVDPIVSADLRGTVLLYNRAAERCYGHRADDVIGKMNVAELYPPGVAREIMRLIRAAGAGGAGRLEEHRCEVLSRTGERIPVSLSAALLYENGEPIGSVGIFTDLRERLRMEERLAAAQVELQNRERKAILAELAGATAHELNQPLTSVSGYAELLKRRLEPGTAAWSAAEVIADEAARMAEIVRKIGKITRYETKSYVGQAKILDLDRASGAAQGEGPGPEDPT